MSSEIYFFSASTNAFYPQSLRADYEASGSWPGDAVQVSTASYLEFGAGNAPAGKQRGHDASGMPVWVDVAIPALSERISRVYEQRKAAYRSESDPLKLAEDYDALIGNRAADYSAWIAKVEEIKQRYPLPTV